MNKPWGSFLGVARVRSGAARCSIKGAGGIARAPMGESRLRGCRRSPPASKARPAAATREAALALARDRFLAGERDRRAGDRARARARAGHDAPLVSDPRAAARRGDGRVGEERLPVIRARVGGSGAAALLDSFDRFNRELAATRGLRALLVSGARPRAAHPDSSAGSSSHDGRGVEGLIDAEMRTGFARRARPPCSPTRSCGSPRRSSTTTPRRDPRRHQRLRQVEAALLGVQVPLRQLAHTTHCNARPGVSRASASIRCHERRTGQAVRCRRPRGTGADRRERPPRQLRSVAAGKDGVAVQAGVGRRSLHLAANQDPRRRTMARRASKKRRSTPKPRSTASTCTPRSASRRLKTRTSKHRTAGDRGRDLPGVALLPGTARCTRRCIHR